jgi:pyridoxal 5'-phosphate synthase pdxT subunit
VDVRGVEGRVRAVFIRAPVVDSVGDDVRVLAEHEDHPVVLEQGGLVVAAFHPELVGEGALHRYVLDKV